MTFQYHNTLALLIIHQLQELTYICPVFLSGQASPALHRPGRAALSGGF